MTGRELIMYILKNGLEDEPVFKEGRFLGFITTDDAAVIFGVGPATIRAWLSLGILPYIEVGDQIQIPIFHSAYEEYRKLQQEKVLD